MGGLGKTLMRAHGFWIGLWLALTVSFVLFVPSPDGMTLHRALLLVVFNGCDHETDANVRTVVSASKHYRQ